MEISVGLRVSAAMTPFPNNRLRRSSQHFHLLPPSKIDYSVFLNGGYSASEVVPIRSRSARDGHSMHCYSEKPLGEYRISPSSLSQEFDDFFLNAINLSFLERLNLAWKIMFPSSLSRRKSNANIAKQRLKMILFSDRCAVSDEAKQKIVSNVVSTLSDYVEIESQDKVQLNVSRDPELGTIYSVMVPVRRVRSEYQEDDPSGTITNTEYKDNGENSSSVDVRFDFYIPTDNSSHFST
ncbi:PREDICTED: cell division topological specificity factor homolog, chloroplastic-like isoform X1 [Ipomoea nil]|uniref:cell division topological specificity factor homolog, chloroplastic-like isoform X1 n=1 Tax=Ipomoea nil TaxID=35883 RepID=UPI000901B49D|nr:PREDICTED: cell division topological specificity factor homolog, chloroplastic-like isoform X1 [Ipomoea nil]